MGGEVDDRELGDQWSDWDGSPRSFPEAVKEGKGLFLGFSALGLIILISIAGLLWYAITPRLSQFNPHLPMVIGFFLAGGAGLLLGWFLMLTISVNTGKRGLPARVRPRAFISFLFPLATYLGRVFRISRDRMGHSFIRVNNALVQSSGKGVNQGKPLLLLPRCLRQPLGKQLTELGKGQGCPTCTVGGGGMARKVVSQVQPVGIVAVACERELVSGIRDFAAKIPVIGIPNRRPQGPCKDTEVDVEEVRKALRIYLKD